jgi:hypothetical protein
MRKPVVAARINTELKTKLDRATDNRRDPYAPSVANIVERGIELALKEFESKRRKQINP